MSESAKMNPLVSIAAVSVTVASLVGVGVMTGLIPGPNKVDGPPLRRLWQLRLLKSR